MPLKNQVLDYAGRLASFNEAVPAPGSPITLNTTGQVWECDVSGYNAVSVQTLGNPSGQAVVYQHSSDGTNWFPCPARSLSVSGLATLPAQSSNSATYTEYSVRGSRRFRILMNVISTGALTFWVNLIPSAGPLATIYATITGGAAHDAAITGNPIRIAGRALSASYTTVATGDTADFITTLDGRQIVLSGAIPENTWSYAAASGGIVNTTAVTIKAAAAAGIRNYLRSLQVINSAAVASEFSVRDGAAGTVLYRGYVPASMTAQQQINFDPPLRGTAATLMEVVMATTATATMFNAQGWIAP